MEPQIDALAYADSELFGDYAKYMTMVSRANGRRGAERWGIDRGCFGVL